LRFFLKYRKVLFSEMLMIWIIPAAVIVAALGAFAYVVYVGTVIFSVAFDSETPKERAFDGLSPKKTLSAEAELARQKEIAWFDGHAESVAIIARDGTKLCGSFFSGASRQDSSAHKNIVVCMHGFRSGAYQMAQAAMRFVSSGWDALVPWQRCHKPSGGRFHGLGYLEQFDALDWAAWLTERFADASIVLYGISMGAATVMMASGSKEIALLPVRAVVADCGFSSIGDQVGLGVRRAFPRTHRIMNVGGSLVTKFRLGFFWRQGRCDRSVGNSPLPKFFIHGTADDFVPFWMLQKIFDAAREPKEKLEVPGAGHAVSHIEQPKLYWGAVDSFLRKNSLPGILHD
jgi:fermentation-respiration switch protein FrsA (DUF1100 family)